MVSFSCEACGDVLTKGKLDKHRNACRRAIFTCIDCMSTFQGGSYKAHTSCISEAQKYQGSFYKDSGGNKSKNSQKHGHSNGDGNNEATVTSTRAMIPRAVTVADENDTDMPDMTVAELDVPPRAPSPPTAPRHNVYDFLVPPSPTTRAALPAPSAVSDDSHYARHGYSYGSGPLKASAPLGRYDSFGSMVPQPGASGSQSFESGHDREGYYRGEESKAYLTPAPSGQRREERDRHGDSSHGKSERKRKREGLEELNTRGIRDGKRDKDKAGTTPGLHSGLTGGLGRLLSRPVEELERQVASPSAGTKRSKREKERNGETRLVKAKKDRRGSSSSEDDDRRDRGGKVKRIEYRRTSAESAARDHHHHQQQQQQQQQQQNGQVVKYGGNPAELFLSFITKGEESEKGMSVNKVLKRFHREKRKDGEEEKAKDREEADKELWKGLRVRRNDRGEIVLFV